MQLLEKEIEQLLAKAEAADSTPLDDGLSVPQEVARRKERIEKLREATAAIEARARERHREEMAAYLEKKQRREEQAATGKKPRGREPQPPSEAPRSKDQYNFTDPESRIMSRAERDSQRAEPLPAGQRRKARATRLMALRKVTTRKRRLAHPPSTLFPTASSVEIESRLIVSQAVSDAPNDKEQLEPTLAATSPVIESVAEVLVDSGFYSAAAVSAIERGTDARSGPRVLAAQGRQRHGRSVEALEKRDDPPEPEPGAGLAAVMAHRLSTKAGRARYGLRKQTIEPVFGIIKAAMGFRRFSLRGLEKVRSEWTLVTLAYNLKRLFHLGTELRPA